MGSFGSLSAAGMVWDDYTDLWRTIVLIWKKGSSFLDKKDLLSSFTAWENSSRLRLRWEANRINSARGSALGSAAFASAGWNATSITTRSYEISSTVYSDIDIYTEDALGNAAAPYLSYSGSASFTAIEELAFSTDCMFGGAFVYDGQFNTNHLSSLAGGADPRQYAGTQDFIHLWSPAHRSEGDTALIDLGTGAINLAASNVSALADRDA